MENIILYNGKYTNITLNKEEKQLIKSLNVDYPSESELQLLFNEYHILRDVQIEGVRKVVSQVNTPNTQQLILEYIEGKTLKQFFADNNLSLINKIKIFISISNILNKVHQAGIIHKDLNPSNILIQSTETVFLIDFGISSRFTLRQSNLGNPEKLEGTLHYLSPEQTGRMNRSVDYRTDLYALGATFYELLTGQPVFEEEGDALSLIYKHLASPPHNPSHLKPEIPPTLSEIILKLLEKNPEDRYQSAFGLAKDLEKCLPYLEKMQEIPPFPLRSEDFSGRLQIPEKLYGREQETQVILEAFERVLQGSVELTLVSGYSGTGKSVLVSETHKPLAMAKGYFIEGKFDQFQRNIPFYAWIQAFKNFIDLLLTENEETLKYWKNTILDALGDNGAVLTEVIPSLEIVIGKQPPLAELGGKEAQNRFNYVMQNFVKAITSEQHPLVIFIDDLQWADLASLHLLKSLVTNQANAYLLCVGAYRDNEVSATHPLMTTLQEIAAQSHNVNTISIGNLNHNAILDLLVDTLQYPKEEKSLKVLKDNILHKTQGNAFFTHQFLKNLYEEELLYFDFEQKQWHWNNTKIESAGFTDNVVEFMAKKVSKLPQNTSKLLQLAACIGNKFELGTLKIIAENNDIKSDLEPAILEGLIFPVRNNFYRFIHDRVQQAAYSLIPEESKQDTHLKIGRLLYNSLSEENLHERIFDIANHYNLATAIFSPEDKTLALKLNLEASLKAKASSSFEGMLKYIYQAKSLIDQQNWQKNYKQTFHIYKLLAEAYYLTTQFEQSEKIIQEIASHAQNAFDKANILQILISQYNAQGKYSEALAIGFEATNLLIGLEMPDTEELATIGKGLMEEMYGRIKEELNIEGIVELPQSEDKYANLAIEIIITLGSIVYFSGEWELYTFLNAKVMQLCLAHGNAPFSPKGYANFAFICYSYGKKDAYQLSRAGFRLAEKNNDKRMQTQVSLMESMFLVSWHEHINQVEVISKNGMQTGFDAGEVIYSVLHVMCVVTSKWTSGAALTTLKQEILEQHLPLALKTKSQFLTVCMNSYLWVMNDLSIEKVAEVPNLEAAMDENTFQQYIEINKTAPTYFYYSSKILTALIFEQQTQALEYVLKFKAIAKTAVSTMQEFEYNFYSSLTYVREYEKSKDIQWLRLVEENQNIMQQWAENCPQNFLHTFLLVQAELYRLKQPFSWVETLETYEQSIQNALKQGYTQYAALACELCAKFLLNLRKQTIAKGFLLEAYRLYKKWQADAKLLWLEEKYLHLLPLNPQATTHTQSTHHRSTISTLYTTASHTNFDEQTILQASQTLSQQVRLKDLIDEMLRLLRQNSGANKIALLRKNENKKWIVEADNEAGTNLMTEPIALEKYENLAKPLIQFVLRSKQFILDDDISQNSKFSEIPYLKEHKSKSILVLPIQYKNETVAVLYLENNLNTNVFTNKRYNLINALATQLAISMENTLLYESLEQKVEARTQELKQQSIVLENLYKNLTDSINYAKHIQTAILPTHNKIKKCLPEYFIFFKPKDVVSGDFYFVEEVEDKIIIAAIDCTGHGVPGAFMSLIGNDIFTEVILNKNITEPNQILGEVHEGVRKLLRQDETHNRDGMDIALAVIDKKRAVLSFAGAKNPIVYIQDQQIHLIKGDKTPIGGEQRELKRIFTKHEIPLEKNTIFYLFSDGIQDQFGGENNRKFSIRSLQKLLLENHEKPMLEQKEVLQNTIQQWRLKGGESQIDDMLLIGVKITL